MYLAVVWMLLRAAVYARVSTVDQEPENQLQELRRYVQARGWTAAEYVDRGVSGAKDRRPALDALVTDARRRLQALGVAFVSLAEGIDATTPAGKLQMHILGAIAEFERARIAERVKVGMRRAKSAGRHVGRRRRDVSDEEIAAVSDLSLRQAANALGVSKSFLHAWRLSRRVV